MRSIVNKLSLFISEAFYLYVEGLDALNHHFKLIPFKEAVTLTCIEDAVFPSFRNCRNVPFTDVTALMVNLSIVKR